MSDGPLDDLNVDITDTDTTIPRLPDCQVAAEITKATVAENSRQDGMNLVVDFATLEEHEAADGKRTVNAGYPLRTWYPLQQSDNPKAPDFRIGLAELSDAALGTSQGNRPSLKEMVSALPGRKVSVRIQFEEDEQYGPSNRVRRVKALS